MGGNTKNDKENNVENILKQQNKINDIISTIKPALIVEYLFGIFRFGVNEDGFVPTKRKLKVIGLLITLIYSVLFFSLFELPAAAYGTETIVNAIDEIPSIVIVVQYVASVISVSFFLGPTTIQIFSTFVDIDSVLRINMNEKFYRNSKVHTTRLLILLFITHAVFTLADTLTDNEFMIRKLITMSLYFEQDLEMFVFCKMVFMLRSRLKIINEYLLKFVQEKDSNKTPIFIINEKDEREIQDKKINFIGRISPNNMKIRDLAEMYDTIGNTCYLINDVFKFQIFMNLVSTFIYIIITIWTSLYYSRSPKHDISGTLITVVTWCILSILSVTVMSFTCESLLTTRNQTKLLVNEIIMDYDLPRTMRIQAKVFMELIEAWPLRIYVYDMFSIDIKLMLKFVSVATTYLIVIIQISHFV